MLIPKRRGPHTLPATSPVSTRRRAVQEAWLRDALGLFLAALPCSLASSLRGARQGGQGRIRDPSNQSNHLLSSIDVVSGIEWIND